MPFGIFTSVRMSAITLGRSPGFPTKGSNTSITHEQALSVLDASLYISPLLGNSEIQDLGFTLKKQLNTLI
jgi:hypothetical protein